MNEQTTLLSRIGKFFKRTTGTDGVAEATADGTQPTQRLMDFAALPPAEDHDDSAGGHSLIGPHEPRSTFLRPWAKRDAAINNLQDGIAALSNLMDGIRDNLEKSGQRQDELLRYLSHLPEALQQLPESSRQQSETLRAIRERMELQSEDQNKLADILERITQADTQHGRTLEALQDRVETLSGHDQHIAENLHQFGAAMDGVTKNSENNAMVLSQMRDNISSRDGELERILNKQGTRFTTMLAVAIFLSISALVAVSVIGYLGFQALDKMK